MKNRTLLIVALIAIVLLVLNTCRLNNKYADQKTTIDSLDLANQTLDSLVNKQGLFIHTQRAIISDNSEALNKLTDSIFNLKKKDKRNQETIAYYKGVTKTTIDTVFVPYEVTDSPAQRIWADSVKAACAKVIEYYEANTIAVPRTARDSTANYSVDLTATAQGISVNNLTIPDTLQLRFVEKRNGLFKPKTIEVQFFHSNPLITTTQANSVIYRPKKKSFFTRVLLPVAIGVGAGIIISK